MVRTQIQLTREQAEAPKNMAAEERVSMAELIRRSIDALVRSSNGCRSQEGKRRAIELSGRFHSGVNNLGSEHDRYLSEDFLS